MGSNDPSKDDFLTQIWSLSTTLTDEAMKGAAAKASESGFDVNRGLVTLSESFINLSSARTILEDAIEKQKLVQLPITVQKELLTNLENISKALQGLTNGVDEVVTLTTAIENLNTSIWKYGLHNLSDQVLGYQKKLNQLKTQEVHAAKLLQVLEKAQHEADGVARVATEAGGHKAEILALLDQSKQSSADAAALLQQIKDSEAKVGALFATIQQNEKQSGELGATTKTTSNEVLALDASIKKFYGEIDEHRRQMLQLNDGATRLISESEAAVKKLVDEANATASNTISSLNKAAAETQTQLSAKIDTAAADATASLAILKAEHEKSLTAFTNDATKKMDAKLTDFAASTTKLTDATALVVEGLKKELETRSEETIGLNSKKTAELVSELASLKEQVRDQIQQATGFTLFGAFQARQNEIVRSKNLWAVAVAVLVAISAGVTIWIAHEAQAYNTHSFAFWVKLSLTLPIGFALTFCTVQYNRERRLEEEYAFKSSISVSLNPYRDLVHSILEKDGVVDKNKYTDFVIESVTKVFTSPTERVFEAEHAGDLTKKTFKDVAEVIGTAVKAAK